MSVIPEQFYTHVEVLTTAIETDQFGSGQALVTTHDMELLRGALGICGEAGEAAELIKKHVFQGHPLDYHKVILECGDVLYYIQLLLSHCGSDIEHAMYENIKKLEHRYPEGFTVESSIKRVDEAMNREEF